MKIVKKIVLFLFCVVVVIGLSIFFHNSFTKPSNDRNWTVDQAILPYADINGNLVKISNIRNFTYTSTTSYTPAYYDKTFDLNKIKRAWYVVEPFSGFGAAHTFLSFEFEGDHFVSISVEIRKEQGETFSATKGLLNQYELMYVIADERDVVKLRSNYRKDLVYVYPMKAEPEKVRSLFLDMITRANKLRTEPEFYNTLTSTCTTNIVKHVNTIAPARVPLSYKVLLPKYSDQLAFDLGLIDTDLPLEKARVKYLINERATKYADAPNFSVKIRQ
jgi:hypothetical protein